MKNNIVWLLLASMVGILAVYAGVLGFIGWVVIKLMSHFGVI